MLLYKWRYFSFYLQEKVLYINQDNREIVEELQSTTRPKDWLNLARKLVVDFAFT